jgi:hypothetical protein
MRRTALTLGIALGVAVLSGCASTPEHLDGQAIPVGARPTSAKPSATAKVSTPAPAGSSTRPTTPTSKASPSRTTSQVIGPTGIGALKIGMSLNQAKTTGLITRYQTPDGDVGCGYSKLKGSGGSDGGVTHSRTLGVVAIQAYGKMRTPEGITFGSTMQQVEEAYPDFEPSEVDDTVHAGAGRASAHASGHVNYRFTFSDDQVVELGLEHDQQDCYE